MTKPLKISFGLPMKQWLFWARLKRDEENETISADYLRLDTETGDLITLASDTPEYLNIIQITNSEVSFGQDTYSLVDGALLK